MVEIVLGSICTGFPVELARKYLMLGLTGALEANFDCLSTYLATGGEILAHDLSDSRGAVSSPYLALSLPKREMYASGMFVLEFLDEFPVEHPLGNSSRGTSRSSR
eukprot:scaffold223984_cov35-Attheya_sp.AAC.1